MHTVIHKAETRGKAYFGWLDSKHTFSFGQYYDPNRIHFGALRVLNDDIVEPGMGFGTHPHDNMEIVSIPLEGALEHKDSTGNTKVIYSGDVQIMSAGSGLTHSEYNHSKSERVNFLQIWVIPKERNITPRYDQKAYPLKNRKNTITTVVAPDNESAVWINQDAWFSLVHLEAGNSVDYTLNNQGNGLYAFVIEGNPSIANQQLNKRDGIGISNIETVHIKSETETQILLMDIPILKLH